MAKYPCSSCLLLKCKCKPKKEFIPPEVECLLGEGIHKNVTVTIDANCKIISVTDSNNQPIKLCDKCR